MYDFIYVEDAAKAFAAVGKKGKTGRTYYIGSLAPRPLKEFLEELGDQIAPEVELGFGELPFQGVSLTYKEFDIHALMTDTGFTPQVSFRQGISRTAEWMRRQG